jgi:hypothetical protein
LMEVKEVEEVKEGYPHAVGDGNCAETIECKEVADGVERQNKAITAWRRLNGRGRDAPHPLPFL